MIIVIDGSKISNESDLHSFLRDQLKLGSFYGCNSAALWDRLTTDVERPMELVWENSEQSRAALGDVTFSKYLKLFRDVAEQDVQFGWGDRFVFVSR